MTNGALLSEVSNCFLRFLLANWPKYAIFAIKLANLHFMGLFGLFGKKNKETYNHGLEKTKQSVSKLTKPLQASRK